MIEVLKQYWAVFVVVMVFAIAFFFAFFIPLGIIGGPYRMPDQTDEIMVLIDDSSSFDHEWVTRNDLNTELSDPYLQTTGLCVQYDKISIPLQYMDLYLGDNPTTTACYLTEDSIMRYDGYLEFSSPNFAQSTYPVTLYIWQRGEYAPDRKIFICGDVIGADMLETKFYTDIHVHVEIYPPITTAPPAPEPNLFVQIFNMIMSFLAGLLG